jgi:RNA polymerase sigma-70 factor (ECF subfamily)
VYPDRRQAGEGDAELVRRSRSGEPEAFDLLVERHTRRLYRVVRRLASDSGEAEAIVQETWLRAWRRLPECEESRPLFPWLAKVAMNVARDRWRRDRALTFADLDVEAGDFAEDEPGPEPRLERRLALQRLADGVERLTPAQRAAVALRYDAGLAYEEIARAMDIPVNTVRTHLHRAKAALRAWMEAEGEGLAG